MNDRNLDAKAQTPELAPEQQVLITAGDLLNLLDEHPEALAKIESPDFLRELFNVLLRRQGANVLATMLDKGELPAATMAVLKDALVGSSQINQQQDETGEELTAVIEHNLTSQGALRWLEQESRFETTGKHIAEDRIIKLMLAEVIVHFANLDSDLEQQDIVDTFLYGWKDGDIKQVSNNNSSSKLKIAKLGRLAQRIANYDAPIVPGSVHASLVSFEESSELSSLMTTIINDANLLYYLKCEPNTINADNKSKQIQAYKNVLFSSTGEDVIKLNFDLKGMITNTDLFLIRDDVSEETKAELKFAMERLKTIYQKFNEYSKEFSLEPFRGRRGLYNGTRYAPAMVTAVETNEQAAKQAIHILSLLADVYQADMDLTKQEHNKEMMRKVEHINEIITEYGELETKLELSKARYEYQIANYQSGLTEVITAVDEMIAEFTEIKNARWGKKKKLRELGDNFKQVTTPLTKAWQEAVDLFKNIEMSDSELALGKTELNLRLPSKLCKLEAVFSELAPTYPELKDVLEFEENTVGEYKLVIKQNNNYVSQAALDRLAEVITFMNSQIRQLGQFIDLCEELRFMLPDLAQILLLVEYDLNEKYRKFKQQIDGVIGRLRHLKELIVMQKDALAFRAAAPIQNEVYLQVEDSRLYKHPKVGVNFKTEQ